jgi:medium-chain acyl-[acyl-carrier-protein] hydrolase
VLELDGTNPELMRNSELRQLLLPIMRADFSVCESYVHTAGEPLACGLTVFGGLQDKRVSQAALEAWREQTSATFALHMMRGGHFFLRGMQQPLVQIISQELARQQTGNTLSTSV